jgi:hypothetical protein
MRMTTNVGETNEYGVKVVGGPYYGIARGNSTRWDYLCPFCEETFRAPTTNFKKAKSCYNCRGWALRKSSAEITWRNHYGMVKSRKAAKEKGFDITLEQFVEISSMDCHYCGIEPSPTKGHRQWSETILTNGLDRVDPSVGYLYSNVVPCCKDCNIAKLDKTTKEFTSWLTRIAQHQAITMSLSTSTRISV